MRMGRTDSRTRMVLVLLAFVVVAAAASVRLGQWQVVEGAELAAQHRAAVIQAKAAATKTVRADIVDRDGRVLARTSTFDQVVAYPDTMDPEDDQPVVELLGALLDLKPREKQKQLAALKQAHEEGDRFISLVPEITLDQSEAVLDAIEDDLLDGVGLVPHQIRHYPRNGGQPRTSLASHVIGFVAADGRGGEGVERYNDERLSTTDPQTIELAALEGMDITLSGLDPEPLELTIDAKLQKQVEKELYIAYRANRAKSVSAMVMDPKTGAILAAASVPAYDAEDYVTIANTNPSKLRNRVFQDQYEPGSVMKIFTVTAALDMGVVTPTTVIRDEVKLKFWEDIVHNSDKDSKGALKVKDVIAMSRNVATAKIAKKLGSTVQKAGHRLYGMWERVGLIGRTNAGVSGEAYGWPYDPDKRKWAAVELANRAFGQGSSFTLPQLARGVSTLVNGGYLVQPYLVEGSEQSKVEPKRVLKPKTARQAKDIMRHVTGSRPHYAKGSLIPGYDVGGKTGTAQIWDVDKGDWKGRRFNHSFIGFIRGRKQEYVIAVRIEEPKPIKVEQGSIPLRIESYQLYQMIARSTIKNMNMKKSKRPEAGLPIIGTDAAKALTPLRDLAANKAARQEAKAQKARQAQKTKQAEKAKPKDSQPKLAADPAPEQKDRGDP